MYQIEKMNQKLLAPQVEEELMNYILHEPVQIGEKIPNEYELASRFGVGRSTIREVVKSLVTKGILEVRRGAGTYVVGTSSAADDPLGLEKFTDKYYGGCGSSRFNKTYHSGIDRACITVTVNH